MDKLPYIIAEAGVNHNGSLPIAIRLIDAAVEAKANAVKFQSFSAKRLVREKTELVPYQKGSASDHYELLKDLELSEGEQSQLAKYAKDAGIQFLSTPYSAEDAEFLLSLGLDTIKVASADLVDVELHALLCKRKVKVLASTGMATQKEVERLAALYEDTGNLGNLWLMQCVSNYPSGLRSQNLRVLDSYKSLVGNRIGFSDHTDGSVAALVAVGLGATVFEKHLTLDRSMTGPDHAASMEPNEFSNYIEGIKLAFESLGSSHKEPQAEELDMRRISRKGLYFKRSIALGEKIERNDLELLRPALGEDAWENLSSLPLVAQSSFVRGDLFRLESNE